VHRTLIDSLRTALVWICSLILYYAIGPPYGEPFSIGWGLIEIDGFALLIIGTLIHNRVLDITLLPCCPNSVDSVIIRGGGRGGEDIIPDRSEFSEPYSLDHTDTFDSSDYDDDDDDDAEEEEAMAESDSNTHHNIVRANSYRSNNLSYHSHHHHHEAEEHEQLLSQKPSYVRTKSWQNYSSIN
ncbi:unnamed protein product, partial [Schistosoma turkestanicum]